MNDACGVDVLHAPEDLVDEELDVVVAQLLRLHDVVQVGTHQVGHEVHVGELGLVARRRENVEKADNLRSEKLGRSKCEIGRGANFGMHTFSWFMCLSILNSR